MLYVSQILAITWNTYRLTVDTRHRHFIVLITFLILCYAVILRIYFNPLLRCYSQNLF